MCESWARVEPVDRSKRLSTFHATPSMSSKAVMKDGKPRNQSTTRNHTSSSFRVQPTLPVPPSRPWTRRALPNPLPASRKTNYVDCTTNCTTTVPASSRDKIAKTSTAISSTLFRGRAWRNDCHSASTTSISSNSLSSGALHHGRAKFESSLFALSGAYSPGNTDRVSMQENKLIYREPRQVQTAQLHIRKIGLRARQRQCALNLIVYTGTEAM